MGTEEAPETAPDPPVVTGVTRYRRKQADAEAIQWTGENKDAVHAFTGLTEGWSLVPHGWYAVKVDGDCFVIAAEDFAARYEPAETAMAPSPGTVPDDTGRDSAGTPEQAREHPSASWRERAVAAERKLAGIKELCADRSAPFFFAADILAIIGDEGESRD